MPPAATVATTDEPRPSRPAGAVAAWSLLGSVVGALVAVAFVVPGAEEPVVTGSVMIALGLGWAAMAVMSGRLTDQPQAWAAPLAGYLLLAGAGLVVLRPDADTIGFLGWVWPPILFSLVVWTVIGARRHLRGRTRRALVYPMCGLLGLAAIGGALATVRDATAPVTAPEPGVLVDTGGHSLYIECAGAGSPTVVLEAGLWGSSGDWDQIAPALAQETTVCADDRAGRGRSEAAAAPQDGLAIAADLHELLAAVQVDGPVVLVGHSSGGVYARVFASEYPEEVAGVVLLDAQPVEAFIRLPSYPGFYSRTKIGVGLMPTLARLGILRIEDAISLRDEFLALPVSLDQGASLTSLGDMPLVVVTAEKGALDGWMPGCLFRRSWPVCLRTASTGCSSTLLILP